MPRNAPFEVERTYAVGDGTTMPRLDGLPGIGSVDPPEDHLLEAVYFDTPDLALAANGVLLWRRSGGDGEGWHLRLPRGGGLFQEVRDPAGQSEEAPASMLRLVRVHLRGRPVGAVARTSAAGKLYRLRAGGRTIAEVWDQQVRSEVALGGAMEDRWREWHIEADAGSVVLLDGAGQLFTVAGAHAVGHASRLERAFGNAPGQGEPTRGTAGKKKPGKGRADRASPGEETRDRSTVGDRPVAGSRNSAGAVVLGYLDAQAGQLRMMDPLVRQDVPDAVHQMRVATRKLRSALATYRRLFGGGAGAATGTGTDLGTGAAAVNRLRAELKWLAAVLGEARDTEVMRERLAEMAAREPEGFVAAQEVQRIDRELGAAFSAAQERVLQTLDGNRYLDLLAALEAFLEAPPLRARAFRKGRKVVPKLVRRDVERLHRHANAALRPQQDQGEHGAALHRARKSAKRLRYAAESAAVLPGKPARRAHRLEQDAHGLQRILGEHQDSVVARDFLHRIGRSASGAEGFGYGRLHAREEALAEQAERDFLRAWGTFRARWPAD